METAVRTKRNVYDSVEPLLSGEKHPCTYTAEEFANVLREADEDYKAGRFVSQDQLFARYGL